MAIQLIEKTSNYFSLMVGQQASCYGFGPSEGGFLLR